MRPDRRRLLATRGTATVAGLAGCGGAGGSPTLDAEPGYRGWVDAEANYEGYVDHRGTEQVEVPVGMEPEESAHFFGPPAVAVTAGTEVQWTWTGRGGRHNVVAEQGAFDSGEPFVRTRSPPSTPSMRRPSTDTPATPTASRQCAAPSLCPGG